VGDQKISHSAAFQSYLKEIHKRYVKGDYTEPTYYTPLENFVRSLHDQFDVTLQPKRIQKIGAPDFKALKDGVTVGYIEAKDLGKNLDNELESEQIKKYKESINNIILTNYSRFILLKNNQAIFDVNLFSLSDLSNPNAVIRESKIEEFIQLTDTFFGYSQPTIRSAKVLAEELAC